MLLNLLTLNHIGLILCPVLYCTVLKYGALISGAVRVLAPLILKKFV